MMNIKSKFSTFKPSKSPQQFFQDLWQRIPKHLKVTFFSAVIIGFGIHMFMLTNKLPNHDDVVQLFSSMHYSGSGRWFLFFPAAFSSAFSIPWVNGALTIFYIATAACFVGECLKIRTTLNCIILSGLMVSMPVVAATMSYMATVDAYFFALLLACASVYVADRYRYGFLISGLMIALVLGIYQAYFSVSAVLMVAVLLAGILRDCAQPKETLLKGLKFFIALTIGLVFYFITVKLTTLHSGLTDYMGIDKMGKVSLSSIPGLIKNAYVGVYDFFIGRFYNIHYGFMKYLFALVILIGMALIVYIIKNKKIYGSRLSVFLLFGLVVIFPLAANAVYLMNAEEIHLLMVYGLVFCLIGILTLLEISSEISLNRKNYSINIMSFILTFVLILSVCNYGIVSNKGYLKIHFAYEQAYAYSERLTARIENTEGFTKDSSIQLIGKPELEKPTPEFDTVLLTGLIDYRYITQVTLPLFLERYLAFSNTITEVDDNESIINETIRQKVESMPSYPDDGSIQMIDEVIYVKFET